MLRKIICLTCVSLFSCKKETTKEVVVLPNKFCGSYLSTKIIKCNDAQDVHIIKYKFNNLIPHDGIVRTIRLDSGLELCIKKQYDLKSNMAIEIFKASSYREKKYDDESYSEYSYGCFLQNDSVVEFRVITK